MSSSRLRSMPRPRMDLAVYLGSTVGAFAKRCSASMPLLHAKRSGVGDESNAGVVGEWRKPTLRVPWLGPSAFVT